MNSKSKSEQMLEFFGRYSMSMILIGIVLVGIIIIGIAINLSIGLVR